MSTARSSRTTPQQRDNSEDAVPEVMSGKMLAAAGVDDGRTVAIPQVEPISFDDDALRAISSFDDAFALLAESDTPVVEASQVIGNGFAILNDKGMLCGVRLLLLGWRFNHGDKGVFASMYVIAQHPGMNSPAKYVVNDGSTGICRQLLEYTSKTGKTGGLGVKNGFRRSDYDYTDPKSGETSSATTFYLDTSA